MPGKTKPETQISKKLDSLAEGLAAVKKDNLTQFGEIKKEFGVASGRLDDHHKRLRDLERDKDRREAVEDYKRKNPGAVNSENGKINSELLKAIMQLLAVIGVLAAALIALKK